MKQSPTVLPSSTRRQTTRKRIAVVVWPIDWPRITARRQTISAPSCGWKPGDADAQARLSYIEAQMHSLPTVPPPPISREEAEEAARKARAQSRPVDTAAPSESP